MAYGVRKQIYAITILLLTVTVNDILSLDLTLGFTQLSPSEVVAHKNKPLLLNCSGHTPPEHGHLTVSWYYEGEIIKEDSGHKILQNGSLYIEKVQTQRKRSGKHDDGKYTCVLHNNVGALRSEPIRVVIAHMAKAFTILPEPIVIEEGSAARFQCQIFAVPAAVVSWYWNDQPLPLSNKWYESLPSGILQVINVSRSLEGQYHCVVNNGFKKRESPKISLAVIDAPKSFEPPQFLSIPSHHVVVENDTVFLECLVKGLPSPKISWKKVISRKIESAIDSKVATITGQGNLVISSANIANNGIYKCVASITDPKTSLSHEITQESTVTVQTMPKFESQPFGDITPTAKTTRFECIVSGSPTPSIQWFKNGKLIYINGRFKELSGNILVISQTIQLDSGIFQCFANNSVGVVSSAARLLVTSSSSQPQPPHGLISKTISSTSILLSWQPSISPLGLNIQAYTVHYWPTIKGFESVAVAIDTTHCTQLVEKLIPFTNYSLYVRAYNNQSASEQSETVTQMTGEDVPTGAPMVTLESQSPTTIKVSWNELSPEIARGIINRYRIYFRRYNQSFHSVIEVSGNVLEYTLTGRTPKRKYEVKVVGGTKIGYPLLLDGQWPWKMIETKNLPEAKVPPAPTLHLTVVNSSTIKANWQLERVADIPVVKGYKLSYRMQGHQLKGPFEVPANVTTFLLSELSLQTWFEVYLVAYNQDGDGEETVRTISTLPEGLSTNSNGEIVEPPSQLEADPIDSASVRLQWKAPATGRNVSYYTVKFRIANSKEDENGTSNKHIRSTNNDVLVADLKPYTLYEFAVRSHDVNNQQSQFSVKIQCMTKEAIPGSPRELSWTRLTTTSVRISWLPPAEPNGVIVAYYIMYKMFQDNAEKENWHINKGPSLSAIIDNLSTNSLYSVAVRAETNAGLGPSSPLISLPIPTRSNMTKTVDSAKNSEDNDPFLGIILGVTIGAFCIIVCIVIILCRNRCFTERALCCCCGQNEQIPVENGIVPQMERVHIVVEGSDLQEMTPMLTHIPNDNHLDTKGGYLINGHANGIHYPIADQNCKPYANGIKSRSGENHKVSKGQGGQIPATESVGENPKYSESNLANNHLVTYANGENHSLPLHLNANGSASKNIKMEKAEKVIPEATNDNLASDSTASNKDTLTETTLLSPSSEKSLLTLSENFDLKLDEASPLESNSVCKYVPGAQEKDLELSLADSMGDCESDEECNVSVRPLLPSKFLQPVTATISNVTAV